MTDYLRFPDTQALTDLKTLVQRARALNDSGIRLQAVDKVLAVWTGVMHGPLASGVPTMVSMRAFPLAEEQHLDVIVELQSLLDRFARLGDDETAIAVPPTEIEAAWAGVSAPRGGWQPHIQTQVEDVRKVASHVAQTMATTLPETPGQAVVNSLRHRVWSETVKIGQITVPQGALFAAEALGFVSGPVEAPVVFYQSGTWTRVTAPHGHILIRN